ncbi:MAG: Lrp/AsnC family transcriptional regulator [Desulfobacteraceae bacterium]|nr:Lrp/AsnC family transcriptional regulator [Desulfobacteraceae bacterium]
MKLDAIDLKIIRILQTQGRITNANLAKNIGISPPAMLERVKRLESSGVITQYVALLNPDLIGVGVIAFIRVSLTAHQLQYVDKFSTKILQMQEVLECHQVSGADDYILKVALKSVKDYREFTFKKLACLEGIQSINSSFVLGTLKYQTALPVQEP